MVKSTRYDDMVKQIMSKVQEIFDGADRSNNIEIIIEASVGSSPCISYSVKDFAVVLNAEDDI